MLIKENNEFGVINFNNNLISQIVQVSLIDYKDKVWLLNDKINIVKGANGLIIKIKIDILFGQSISQITNHIIDFIKNEIEQSLEISIEDIIIDLKAMRVKGRRAKRNIVVKLSDRQ